MDSKQILTHDERKLMQNINAIMMDCTLLCRMFQRSTDIYGGDSDSDNDNASNDNAGNGNGNGNSSGIIVRSTRIQLRKSVKNIRLTHGQSKQQSRCKTRLVLLLLGLWMNLIAVTNGKWKIQLVKHMFLSFFSSLRSQFFFAGQISFRFHSS